MPLPLPILPARQRFYDLVTIIDIAPGETIDGEWHPGTRTERQIMGSFQSPQPLSVSMQPSGDAGIGMRELFTRAYLPYYDVNSAAQTLVYEYGILWRITDRRYWGPISQRLFVYECERYEEPASAN